MAKGLALFGLACGLLAMACAGAVPDPEPPSAPAEREPQPSDRVDPQPIARPGVTRAPFPRSVAGITFGAAPPDFYAWCSRHAGNVVAFEQIVACHGLRLPDFPLRIDTVIPTFCQNRLCRVSLNITRPPPTPTETLAAIATLEQAFGPGMRSSRQTPCSRHSAGRYWIWGDASHLWSVSVDSSCRMAGEEPILSVVYSTPQSYLKTPEAQPWI